MRLSAIIVAFNPDISELCYNLKTIINEVEKVVIYQNSAVFDLLNLQTDFIDINQSKKISFLGNGKNVGIAKALNEGVKWSIDNDLTHILTLDQDSSFKTFDLKNYKNIIDGFVLSNVGCYGINPNSWGHLLYDTDKPYLEVTDTITSGSIFPLSVFGTCGLFDEDLFIDAVDYDYCYRLKTFGFKTIVFPAIILEHKVGNATKSYIGFSTDNYSAFRTYFLVRNQIAIWKKYPNFFPYSYKITLIKSHIVYRLIKILISEDNKVKKILSIATGLTHGLIGKTGFYRFD